MAHASARGGRAFRRRPSATVLARRHTGRAEARRRSVRIVSTCWRTSDASTASSWSGSTPPRACAVARENELPNSDIALTKPRSTAVSASRRAASSDVSVAGTSSSRAPRRAPAATLLLEHASLRKAPGRARSRRAACPRTLERSGRVRRRTARRRAPSSSCRIVVASNGSSRRAIAPRRAGGPAASPSDALERVSVTRRSACGGPIQELVDEVAQPLIGELKVFEDEDHGQLHRQALEELPPAGEQVARDEAWLVGGRAARLAAAQERLVARHRAPTHKSVVRAAQTASQGSRPRRSRAAGGPSRRAPSRRRRRRMRGSDRACQSTGSASTRRRTGRTPCETRLADPDSPVSVRSRADRRSSAPWKSSFISHSSASRPTKGESCTRSPSGTSSTSDHPPQPQVGWPCPSRRCSPAGTYAINGEVTWRVMSSTNTVPGSAAAWIRAAVLTRSPTTRPSPGSKRQRLTCALQAPAGSQLFTVAGTGAAPGRSPRCAGASRRRGRRARAPVAY